MLPAAQQDAVEVDAQKVGDIEATATRNEKMAGVWCTSSQSDACPLKRLGITPSAAFALVGPRQHLNSAL